jgi:hypothetical protein
MPVLVSLLVLLLALAGPAAAQTGCTTVDGQVFCGFSTINGFTTQSFQTQTPGAARVTCVGFEPGATHQGFVHIHNPSGRSVPVTLEWLNLQGVVVVTDQFSLDAGRTTTVGRGDAALEVPTVVRVIAPSVSGKGLLVDGSMVYDFAAGGPNLNRRQVACFKK